MYLPAISFALVMIALWLVFCVAPAEQVMGAAQRIFYFHVASAMSCYGAIAVAFAAGVSYLLYRNPRADAVAEAALSVGALFCSIVLFSGMIWGHSAWNTWWRWEPRLVSFLVLWLILFAASMVRSAGVDESRRATIVAIFSIVAAVNVPIVIFSIKLLAQSEQLHPQVVANQGLTDPRYILAFVVANAAMFAVGTWLFVMKLGNVLLRSEILQAIRTRPEERLL